MNKTIYKQLDSRWASLPYPTKASSFGGNGCGCVACVHIAIEQKAKKDWTPKTLRPWMVKQGYAVAGQGTTWNGITETLEHIGHKDVVRVWASPMSVAFAELNKGSRIGIILFNGGYAPNGTHWCGDGHYVAFTDYKVKDGKHFFYCKDSGPRNHDGWFSYENSMKGCIAKVWIVERLDAKKEKSKETSLKVKSTYGGKFPSLTLKKTNAEVRADAVTWGRKIAKDNDFHYGAGKEAHHNGCYFCKTNGKHSAKAKAGIKKYEHTYCCNPFVHACYAHGGCDPTALDMCQHKKSWGFGANEGYEKCPELWKKLGKPTLKKLKAGDVLCNSHHVAMYIGDGKVVEAGAEDDNKIGSKKWNNSIRVRKYRQGEFTRAYRYKGSVNKKMPIIHGELSDRVKFLSKYLKWYGFSDITVSRFFDDKMHKAVKKFQKKNGLPITGVVDANTLKAMKKVKR